MELNYIKLVISIVILTVLCRPSSSRRLSSLDDGEKISKIYKPSQVHFQWLDGSDNLIQEELNSEPKVLTLLHKTNLGDSIDKKLKWQKNHYIEKSKDVDLTDEIENRVNSHKQLPVPTSQLHEEKDVGSLFLPKTNSEDNMDFEIHVVRDVNGERKRVVRQTGEETPSNLVPTHSTMTMANSVVVDVTSNSVVQSTNKEEANGLDDLIGAEGSGSIINTTPESLLGAATTTKPETTLEPTTTPEPTTQDFNTTPESTSEPTPESTSEPTPESTSEPTPESTSEPTPESTSEPTPESTSEPTTESTSEPTPESTSEPTPESTSEPTPESTSEPTPESTSEPTPESTSEPTPESTSEPTPESTSEPTPESTSEPTPESTSEPTPESTSEPTPESTSEPTPESTSEPTPESTSEFTPESTSEPTPESTSEPTPESTSEPTPESTSEPTPESTSEPTPESTSDPTPESTSEPTPESTSEPTPESTSEPTPESTSEPTPESTYESTPESTSEPTPEYTSEPTPESTSEPTPESTSEPTPESTSEPTPESTSEPTPESTSEPTPESTSEPTPESTSEPTPESTSEPTPETTSEPKPETTSDPKPETTSEPKPEPTSEPTPETTSETKPEPTSEPKPEPTSEPTPETTSETKPEPSVTPEPETGDPEPEDEASVFSEPRPEWDEAIELWQWGWYFFVYFFGVMFLLLAVFSIMSVIRLWGMNHLLSKNYFVTLNILIIVKCVLRGAYLLVDPHNINNTFHSIVDYFLYSTAFPCLTSAFSILFYALMLATKMQVISPKIQKISVLVGIILFHFALSIVSDVIVGIFSEARVLLLVCQLFYIVWGLVLFVGYFYLFRRLYSAAIKRQKSMIQQTVSTGTTASDRPRKTSVSPTYTISLSIKVTFVAAIFGLICVALEMYGIFGVYKVLKTGHTPEPWPWYIYKFSLRLMELLMCATMVYVASQPLKYRRNNNKGICWLYLKPFKRICCCNCSVHTSNDSDTYTNSEAHAMSDGQKDKKYFDKADYTVRPQTTSKPRVTYAPQVNGRIQRLVSENPSHLVIEDGLVRFRSEDELNDCDSDLGMSLPDLVNGNVPRGGGLNSEAVANGAIPQGVLNGGYYRTESEAHNNNNKRSPVGNPSTDQHKSSMDFERTSIGTVGTDTMRPLSSLNLAASMEWEFDRVYERSFVESDSSSVKSLPNVVPLSSRENNMESSLITEQSPNHFLYSSQSDDRRDSLPLDMNQISLDTGSNLSSPSEHPSSPTRKPLITKRMSRHASTDSECLDRFKTNIYTS